jgi:uncharacterized protein (DUF924 family)
MQEEIKAIHQFWFGPLDDTGFAAPQQNQVWFSASAETDAALGSRFGNLVTQALAGQLDHWAADDKGLIALVLLLDQFTRNIYRGTPDAFAGDTAALKVANEAISSERHPSLPAIHQVFLYMPLEHCEDLEVQQDCVRLLSELSKLSDAQRINESARYAVAHRDVIAKFGRFPHRNTILGRESSEAELAYLKQHGGF